MKHDTFALLVAHYGQALIYRTPEVGRIEREVIAAYDRLNAENERLREELQACRVIQKAKNEQIHLLIQQVNEVAQKSRVGNERRCAYCLSKPAQPDGTRCAECEAELEQRAAEQGA